MQIGKYNLGILEEIRNLYLHDFGIFVEMSPDEEEKAQLETNIQMALQQGGIDLEDAIDIRTINNLKMANQLLKVKRKQSAAEKREQEQQAQAMQNQQQQQLQQQAAQAAMQQSQQEMQTKIQIKQAEIAFEIEKQKNEADLKRQLMQVEFNMNMQLRGMEQSQIDSRETQREDSKAKRISQAGTQQSKMITQRKTGGTPINFESNEDSLDGFDLSEFDPR
jgi:type II secretory pathway pseudopilin PulG